MPIISASASTTTTAAPTAAPAPVTTTAAIAATATAPVAPAAVAPAANQPSRCAAYLLSRLELEPPRSIRSGCQGGPEVVHGPAGQNPRPNRAREGQVMGQVMSLPVGRPPRSGQRQRSGSVGEGGPHPVAPPESDTAASARSGTRS